MSVKRLWKLGSLEHRMTPTQEAFEKLQQMLESGNEDLLWGPDIEVINLEEGNEIEEYVIYNIKEDDGTISAKAIKMKPGTTVRFNG